MCRGQSQLPSQDESTSQISFDVWQLYSQFVHEGAPDKILFDDDTVAEFKRAIESKDPHELDRIIEKVDSLPLAYKS